MTHARPHARTLARPTILAAFALACALAGCSRANAGSAFPELDPAQAKVESWNLEELGPTDFLVFGAARVTISKATCLRGAALDCEGLRTLKAGEVVPIKKALLDGRMSPGARVCQALKNELLNGRGPGGEDGFCKFGDGSLVSTGALERYSMKIVP
jgi:hypothetical protein